MVVVVVVFAKHTTDTPLNLSTVYGSLGVGFRVHCRMQELEVGSVGFFRCFQGSRDGLQELGSRVKGYPRCLLKGFWGVALFLCQAETILILLARGLRFCRPGVPTKSSRTLL